MIEKAILTGLINHEDYTRRVIPYIEREYFSERSMGEKIIFSLIKEHYLKYNKQPSKEMIRVSMDSKNIRENLYEQAVEVLDSINTNDVMDVDWLIDETEVFCKKRAFYNAILKASEYIDKDDTSLYHGAIEIVSKAISVGFDGDLGSNYFDSAMDRFESLKKGQDKLACGIKIFDIVTKGGFVNPSLTVFIAPTGVGKSLMLCNLAAAYLREGKNVLYFTMEMEEEQVEQRIDLNFLDLTTDQMKSLNNSQFFSRMEKIRKTFSGDLITKRFVSGAAHSGHFRHFIEEIKIKKDFKPDVIIVDYLNICASATTTKAAGPYDFFATIAVELRGLGQEFNCPVFTATQTNREGTKAADFEITDVADSWGIAHNADYVYGLIETEELAKQGQMRVKRLKDRYNDYMTWYSSFSIGVDKTKQRVYDISLDLTDSERKMIEDEFTNMLNGD